MGDKEAPPNVTTDRTVGMSGGFNKNGTVMGRHNGVMKTYNAPEKVNNTDIRRCTNVTKTGDVDGKGIVRIGGGGGGWGGTPSPPLNARQNTVPPQRKEQMAMRNTLTEGMSGGRNEGGTVFGENNGEVYTHNAPGKISNTKIEDSHNVTSVNDVTGDTVEIGGGGAGPSIDGRDVQNTQHLKKKDPKDFTVEEIQDMLRQAKINHELIRNFNEMGISGKFFCNLKGPMLEELGVKPGTLDEMKIETLIKEISEQSQGQ